MLNPILTAHGFGKGGGGIEYKKVSTATALRDKQGVIADTSGGTFVVSLPNSPREGTQCSIVDGGDWSANPLTVDPVGAAIEGQPAGETLTLDIGSIEAQFVYTGTKWKVFVKLVSPSGNVVTTNGVQRLSNKTLETTNVDGDLSFTGQGRRIFGDFSNATITYRTAFQTSTPNGQTSVGLMPNGTGNFSQLALYNSSDINNSSLFDFLVNNSFARFRSLGVGTGVAVPMTFVVGTGEHLRLDSNGNASMSAPAGPLSTASGRVYLSLRGKGTTGQDSSGNIQFQSNSAGANLPNIGNIEWCLPDNTSSTTTRVAYITVAGVGSAANNRGAVMSFGTKADGVAGGGNGVLTIDENGHTKPGANNAYDLGSTTLRWRNIYTQDLHLSNGIGDYTMIEGEEDLFLVNNKNGKHYKFALIDVDPSEVPPKSEAANGS